MKWIAGALIVFAVALSMYVLRMAPEVVRDEYRPYTSLILLVLLAVSGYLYVRDRRKK